jgi:hypothetical protein
MPRESLSSPQTIRIRRDSDARAVARAAVRLVGGQVLADTYADGVDYRLQRWPLTLIGDVRVLDSARGEARVTARLTALSAALIATSAIIASALLFAALWLPAPASLSAATGGTLLAVLTALRSVPGAPRRVRQRLVRAVAHAAKSA